MYYNPNHGPLLIGQIGSLSDGYFRIPLLLEAALHLAVIFPSDTDKHHSLIALPLTLPMGWSHSPPYFCAYTETITDVANDKHNKHNSQKHRPLPQTQCVPLPQPPNFIQWQ